MDSYLYSFVGIFVAMDVIGILPLVLNITKPMDFDRKTRVVRVSIFVAAAVALIFAFVGKSIFKLMGITIYDFKVGGGIVLLVMAILDLVKNKSSEETSGHSGIVPLAVPLITGPGLITTMMLQVSLYGHVVVLITGVANFLLAWVVLRNGERITKYIGSEGTDIVSKIAALFMTAIAFSMIRSGLTEAFRSL